VLSSFLKRHKYDVTSVFRADSALQYFQEKQHILFLQPDMDGLDLIKKTKEKHKDQTFILMTNYSDI
jgi:DNA-binding NtrC family response regulator